MTPSCSCISIKHKAPCREPVKYRCRTCGDTLCSQCAKQHHPLNHSLEKYVAPPTR